MKSSTSSDSAPSKNYEWMWQATMLVSIAYTMVYLYAAHFWAGNKDSLGSWEWDGLTGGFCVANGTCDANSSDPFKRCNCGGTWFNSHVYAAAIDGILSVIVGIMWFMDQGTTKEKSEVYTITIFSIAPHGLFHGFAGTYGDCDLGFWQVSIYNPLHIAGDLGLFAFAFYMVYATLSMGVDKGRIAPWVQVLASIVVGVGTAIETRYATGSWGLSALFIVDQPLWALAVLLGWDTNSVQDPLTSALLLGSTLSGLLEIGFCNKGFASVGGHFWFDFLLNASFVTLLAKDRGFIGNSSGVEVQATPTAKNQDLWAPATPWSKAELAEKKFL